MQFRYGPQVCAREFLRIALWACVAIMFASPCRAQDPLERYPQNYQLVFENAQVSVIRVHYGPHERIPAHNHSDSATLFVYLSDSGPVRFRIAGVPPTSIVRPAVSAGSFRYSPGAVERHSVQSLSEQSSDFYRIELRQFPLQGGEAFRHGPPASLNADMDETEFNNDQIEVKRVVCLPGRTCPMDAIPEPSLIVALNDVGLTIAGNANQQGLKAGDVKWVGERQAITVSAAGSAPAHLLRIGIKSPKHRPVS